MQNNFNETIQRMYKEGLKDEDEVIKITEAYFKCQTEKATKMEDMRKHVDFWVLKEDKRFGIDVKGVRKNNRSDKYTDDSINWIELQNVNGNKGWIYGESVYIAFKTNTSILYVPTKALQKFVEEKVEGKTLVNVNPKECYCPYQRQGRKDIIIKVPTEDLRQLAKHEISLNG